MTSPQQRNSLMDLTAVDANGGKIGKVGQVYLNDETGQPVWVTVSTGLFGNQESFAPLYNAGVQDDKLVLAVPQQLVKNAPTIDSEGHLGEQDVDALYQHYADYLPAGTGHEPAGDPGYLGQDADASAGQQGVPAEQGDGPAGRGSDAMTRSEERLQVGTEKVATGRARLRKYVLTENVTTTVPVSHEEVRLERTPVTEANRADAESGTGISEAEQEVTLHAERPVVAKEAVPVERVRLNTETVTEEQEISEQVRKEQIDDPQVDQDPDDAGR
jgi:uncharacterized protein (TIGR02271 family)